MSAVDVQLRCTILMHLFGSQLHPELQIMDPILLMFSIFTLWRLARESPDQGKGLMQEIKTAILKEQRPQQEVREKRRLVSYRRTEYEETRRGRDQVLFEPWDPSFHNAVL